MKTILVLFKNVKLDSYQIEAFRKDINIRTENRYDLLHNHLTEGGFFYRYPKIQFRAFKGYAALFGLDEGRDLVLDLLAGSELGEVYTSHYEIVSNSDCPVQVEQKMNRYSVRDLVPFNADSYRQYRTLDSLADRASLLERRIATHIVQFCKEMEVPFEKGDITVKLKALKKQPEPEMKNERMLSFDIIIETNVNLPDFMGLGRFKSLGKGVIMKM